MTPVAQPYHLLYTNPEPPSARETMLALKSLYLREFWDMGPASLLNDGIKVIEQAVANEKDPNDLKGACFEFSRLANLMYDMGKIDNKTRTQLINQAASRIPKYEHDRFLGQTLSHTISTIDIRYAEGTITPQDGLSTLARDFAAFGRPVENPDFMNDAVKSACAFIDTVLANHFRIVVPYNMTQVKPQDDATNYNDTPFIKAVRAVRGASEDGIELYTERFMTVPDTTNGTKGALSVHFAQGIMVLNMRNEAGQHIVPGRCINAAGKISEVQFVPRSEHDKPAQVPAP